MNKIVSILMTRDGISENEAQNILDDCRSEIEDVLNMGGGYDEVEDIVKYFLGLEMDYLFDLYDQRGRNTGVKFLRTGRKTNT